MENNENNNFDPIKYLSEKLNENNMTITFGLQPSHIEVIENELERWRGMEKIDGDEFEPKYSKYIWDSLGEKLSWEPFTLALYYFEYLEEKNKNERKNN